MFFSTYIIDIILQVYKRFMELVGSLFYDAISVTVLYIIDDKVISE
jgi:hypothetical protein